MLKLIFLFCLGLGCAPAPPCAPVVTEAWEDGSALDAVCTRAGNNLQRLKCAEALPDYADYCRHRVSRRIPYRPGCIASVKTCAEVEIMCSPRALKT